MHSESVKMDAETKVSAKMDDKQRSAAVIFNQKRRKRSFKCRRNALIFFWTLAFAYYSVVNAEIPVTNTTATTGKFLLLIVLAFVH